MSKVSERISYHACCYNSYAGGSTISNVNRGAVLLNLERAWLFPQTAELALGRDTDEDAVR